MQAQSANCFAQRLNMRAKYIALIESIVLEEPHHRSPVALTHRLHYYHWLSLSIALDYKPITFLTKFNVTHQRFDFSQYWPDHIEIRMHQKALSVVYLLSLRVYNKITEFIYLIKIIILIRHDRQITPF